MVAGVLGRLGLSLPGSARRGQSGPVVHEQLAAIDLGSNSFHLLVARYDDARGLQVIDRLREPVRLGAGLDRKRNLREDAREAALRCLERFGQRLRGMPAQAVRAVGTNTLRQARNAPDFQLAAEQALGFPIEVISGVEEARLIYLGVAHTRAEDDRRRLVIDIGGGSTEVIVGERYEPVAMDSLFMGCVSHSYGWFHDGAITRKSMERAVLAAEQEFEPVAELYRGLGWDQAIGASGTIRAVSQLVGKDGTAGGTITNDALTRLSRSLVEAGHVDRVALGGLDPDRGRVLPGGVAILVAAFRALGIEQMDVSAGALREGLIFDLVGRLGHEDARDRTVRAMSARYGADAAQVERVMATALSALAQVADRWSLDPDRDGQLLSWAVALHEIGLQVAHTRYHKHGSYLVENADMPGFSRDEQRMLALLVRSHRRKFPMALFKDWREPARTRLVRLAMLLRLAVVLHRARSGSSEADFRLHAHSGGLRVAFDPQWIEAHPLIAADLGEEAQFLASVGLELSVD